MDLTLLRSFLTVARQGAITESALALHVTQSALSRRIRMLEDEIGAPLFERSRTGVALTEMGRLVQREAQEIVERYDRLKASVGAHVRLEAGTVRIGGGATAVSFLVPSAIAAFRRSHPGVRFQVKEAGSREIEQDVRSERLDLGIVTLPARAPARADDLEAEALRRDEIVLVAARDHPLCRGAARRVAVAALAGEGLVGFEAGSEIRMLIDGALRDAGVEMNVVMELRSIPAIVQMAATTKSLAFVSRLGVARGDRRVHVVDVRGLRIHRQLAILRRRDRPLSPAATAFATLLREAAAREGMSLSGARDD